MNKFDNNVLLNIYRNYSKDEAVAYLKTLIEPLQKEIGILKSELEESIAKNKPINILNNELQFANKQLRIKNNDLENEAKKLEMEIENFIYSQSMEKIML